MSRETIELPWSREALLDQLRLHSMRVMRQEFEAVGTSPPVTLTEQ